MKGLLLRFPLYVLILLVGIYLSENFVPTLDGRKDLPPDSDTKIARTVLYSAFSHGAKDYFPLEYDESEYQLDLARKSINSELAQQWVFRDFTYSSRRLSEAQEKVMSLLHKTANKESHDKIDAQTKLKGLERILAASEALLKHASTSVLARQRFVRATLIYKTSKDFYDRKKYASSLKTANEAFSIARKSMETSEALLARYADPSLRRKWNSWKNNAITSSRDNGTAIVVDKEGHKLYLYKKGSLYRSFDVELGANSINQKMYAGDRATPEGQYRVTRKKSNGQSKYGQALLINYPNDEDKRRFQYLKSRNELGRGSRIGGLIEIHGGGGRGFDWTDGCVALTDKEMEWLYKATPSGTVVVIIGSNGNEGRITSALKKAVK